MTKVQSLSEGGRELECGDLVHALKECLAAMESMRTQIEQMRGLFDDADGAIAGACRDHEAADSFARSVLEAEGSGYGKSCMDRLYIATAALRDLHVGFPHDEIAAVHGTGLRKLVRELVNFLRENGIDDEGALDCEVMDEIEPKQAENTVAETPDALSPVRKGHTK
jgi:hypothetical protein